MNLNLSCNNNQAEAAKQWNIIMNKDNVEKQEIVEWHTKFMPWFSKEVIEGIADIELNNLKEKKNNNILEKTN